MKRYIDRLIELGHRREDEISFELMDGGLAISGGGMRHAIDWTAFLEIASAPHHWLLITGPMSFILPKRAFASADQERSFLAEVAGHLTAEAQKRSAEAIATAFG
ncbi:YcxB family protein [Novosphingobium sp. G106]|uniref:YcxB family protein n=1 Tax=Novosphingobium sp. G106 TaxID=2849500 RepID=UPI001C2CD00F|nr:YcxB family protein [Novosphingobium sp. G106]MBV1692368.1 YcxB family protein [Novosphingobium sp. G106]